MGNKPGYSWGVDSPVNMVRFDYCIALIDYRRFKFIAVYPYDRPDTAWRAVFAAMRDGAKANYGTVTPPPTVIEALDSVS